MARPAPKSASAAITIQKRAPGSRRPSAGAERCTFSTTASSAPETRPHEADREHPGEQHGILVVDTEHARGAPRDALDAGEPGERAHPDGAAGARDRALWRA